MLIILFGAIIIFLSDKSRSNRVRSEGSASNWSMRCGGGRALPTCPRDRGTARLIDVGSGRGLVLHLAPPSPPLQLKHNNLLPLIPPTVTASPARNKNLIC